MMFKEKRGRSGKGVRAGKGVQGTEERVGQEQGRRKLEAITRGERKQRRGRM